MPDLTSLISYLPTIWTAVTGLLGGGATMGLVKLYRTYWTQQRQNEAQSHNQDIELSSHLEERLTKVEGRLDAAEDELRSTKEELSRARIRGDEMRASIEALVQRIDKLIDRLSEHEDVSEEEREELISPPYIDLKSNNHTQQ
jgi:predicted nuclease with TOPRIM domain